RSRSRRYSPGPRRRLTLRRSLDMLPRYSMHFRVVNGPVEFLVLQSAGQLVVASNGGFTGEDPQIIAYDFSGLSSDGGINLKGLIQTYTGLNEGSPEGKYLEQTNGFIHRVLERPDSSVLLVVRHAGQPMYSQDRIDSGLVAEIAGTL